MKSLLIVLIFFDVQNLSEGKFCLSKATENQREPTAFQCTYTLETFSAKEDENTTFKDISTHSLTKPFTTIPEETSVAIRETASPSPAHEEVTSSDLPTFTTTERSTSIGITTTVSGDPFSQFSDYTILPDSSTAIYYKATSVATTGNKDDPTLSTGATTMMTSHTTLTPQKTSVTTTENTPSGSVSYTLTVSSSPLLTITSPESTQTTLVTTTGISHSRQAPTTSTVSSMPATSSTQCPLNMVYADCTCQGTCQSPLDCDNLATCSGLSCVCPNGFLMQGEACIPEQECGCFFEDSVLAEGLAAVDSVCSKECVCTNNELVCDETFQCDQLATCGTDDRGMTGCNCQQGYYGDGLSCQTEPSDCYDLYKFGTTTNGIYSIKPLGWQGAAFEVHCDMADPDGPWLVIQRRTDGSTGFNRVWTVYQDGIPATSSEFWIGNERLFYLTNQKQYELRIDFTNAAGIPFFVTYDYFLIGDSSVHYPLTQLGTHGGNAVDALRSAVGHGFSTLDADNDEWSDATCDWQRNGGWWYRPGEGDLCFASNLNGDWYGTTNTGITWGQEALIKSVEMKLRPKQYKYK